MKDKGTAATTDEASSNSSKLVDQRSSLVRRVPMFSVACSRLSKIVTRALANQQEREPTRKATWKVHSSLLPSPHFALSRSACACVSLRVGIHTLSVYHGNACLWARSVHIILGLGGSRMKTF